MGEKIQNLNFNSREESHTANIKVMFRDHWYGKH